jgi:hypothetical protein
MTSVQILQSHPASHPLKFFIDPNLQDVAGCCRIDPKTERIRRPSGNGFYLFIFSAFGCFLCAVGAVPRSVPPPPAISAASTINLP